MRMQWMLVAAVAAVGCNKHPAPEPPSGMPALDNAAARPATATANAPAAPAAAGQPAVQGKVLEKIDQGGYSYLRIQTSSGEEWAAVPQADVAVGATVALSGAALMQDFESKTLHRKWPRIWFGSLAPVAAGGEALGAPPKDAVHAGMGGPPAVAPSPEAIGAQHAVAARGGDFAGDVKVEKAKGPDARTVGEVWAQRAALKDKTVAVRGKVVKYTGGVMGKNWVHVRDGSGAAGDGTNDLTATTDGTTAVGEVVTVRGAVHVDKDFGAGYSYPVIIEQATLEK